MKLLRVGSGSCYVFKQGLLSPDSNKTSILVELLNKNCKQMSQELPEDEELQACDSVVVEE